MNEEPKKEVKRPENRPRAVKMSDEEFERFYAEIYKEFGPAQTVKGENMISDIPVRGASSAESQTPAKTNAYTDTSRAPAPAKKEKGLKGLIIAVCLESLGIVGVVLWWLLVILR